MGRLDRGESRGGKRLPGRRQQRGRDGLAGQRVPEAENLAAHRQQLAGDAALQCRGHHACLRAGRGPEQLPVEAAPEQRGRREHEPLAGRECGQPRLDRLGERLGHARGREYLFDQERHAVRRELRPDDQLVVSVGHARAHHPLHLVGVQAVKRQMQGGAAGRQPPGEPSGWRRRLVPAGGQQQDTLAPDVVGEELQDRQRVRIRPVQILQDDHQSAIADAEQADQPDHRFPAGHRGSDRGFRGRPWSAGPMPGRIAASAGSQGASPPSAGSGRSRRMRRSASVSGRYGIPDPAGTARPADVSAPGSRASAASSRTSRDLPMPGSPVINTTQP
jgi:hypothetical protein